MASQVWPCALACALAAAGCDAPAVTESAAPGDPPAKAQPATPDPAAPRPSPHPSLQAAGDGLHVVLLGTGTPIPDPQRAPPATAVVAGHAVYLVDAGPGVVRQVEAARREGLVALDPRGLDRLFLTHLHSDHSLGVSEVMRSPAVVGRVRPLEVYGPEGTEAMIGHLREAYRVDERIRFQAEGARPGFEVRAHDLTADWHYRDAQVEVRAVPVAHGLFEHAVGYHFQAGDRRVVVSGDTGPTDAIARACDGCDVLVHEVYCASGLTRQPPSVQAYHRHFHTSTRELAALAGRARPGLLVLTHLLPFDCSPLQLLQEVRSGYAGEVVIGEDLGVY